ncbi:hypothetical protein L580_4357 [Serratia fonticola AU-P3(3)]|nr:hypothetical protein L580_4357 [Serratia fonticola AU-P3(3)]
MTNYRESRDQILTESSQICDNWERCITTLKVYMEFLIWRGKG